MATILLVDDAKFMRQRMIEVLKELSHDVIGEAENGKVAIGQYFKLKPDIVILDITMPGVGGKEALKQIMKIDPDAKIIMCSAVGSEEIVAECISEGARAYIVKPFNKEQAEDSINRVMAGETVEVED